MQDLLISVLKPKIEKLPFITLFGGLAQTLRTWSDGREVRQPISNEPGLLLQRGLDPKQYVSLAPDGREKGVAYFEHRSMTTGAVEGGRLTVNSVLRLVYWGALGDDPSAPILAQTAIMKTIPDILYTARPLSHIFHEVSSVIPHQGSLFDKYTYDEKQLQYLMSPYTAFAIEIKTRFKIALSCLPSDGPQLDVSFSDSFNSTFG